MNVQVQLPVRDIKNNTAATATVYLQLIIVNLIIFWANMVRGRITAMNQQRMILAGISGNLQLTIIHAAATLSIVSTWQDFISASRIYSKRMKHNPSQRRENPSNSQVMMILRSLGLLTGLFWKMSEIWRSNTERSMRRQRGAELKLNWTISDLIIICKVDTGNPIKLTRIKLLRKTFLMTNTTGRK